MKQEDVLGDIELPLWVFVAGIPSLGAITIFLGHVFFGIGYLTGLIAVPLAFVFTLIAVNATGLTSITPTGALGKLTQLTYSVLAPGNITTNIMTAGITGEVAGNASNLLMDIKPGYMLGGKPRHQAMGHVLGIFAGAAVSVPVFYLIFQGDLSLLTSEKFPLPGAQVWAAVANVLTRGLESLHPTARWAVLAGAILGLALEITNQKTRGRFPLCATAMGLAFVIPFSTCFAMFLGAFGFWVLEKTLKNPQGWIYRIGVENRRPFAPAPSPGAPSWALSSSGSMPAGIFELTRHQTVNRTGQE